MNTRKRPFEALINRHLNIPTSQVEFVLLSPDEEMALLLIQKNASSFIWNWALENGWSGRKTESVNPRYLALILREPISRWKSGVVQFLSELLILTQRYSDEQIEIEWSGIATSLIKSAPALFDIHTWPQHYWHTSLLPMSPRFYFKLEDHLNFTLAKTFKWNPPSENLKSSVVDNNVGKIHPGKLNLIELVEDMLEKDPEFLLTLQAVFKEDIEIYNSVDFTTKRLTEQDIREGVTYDTYN